MLRSSLVLSFLCEYDMGIRHLLWLRASTHGFIRTNEERSTKLFFALSAELNYNPETVKERAKKHFATDCFQKLMVGQMDWLIDRLLERQWQREQQR